MELMGLLHTTCCGLVRVNVELTSSPSQQRTSETRGVDIPVSCHHITQKGGYGRPSPSHPKGWIWLFITISIKIADMVVRHHISQKGGYGRRAPYPPIWLIWSSVTILSKRADMVVGHHISQIAGMVVGHHIPTFSRYGDWTPYRRFG
jgi:hypothetical protein